MSRAMDFFGAGKVRSIYEAAVELELPDTTTKVLCTRYARLERKLGEIDRARGLYIHASQFANPQQDAEFWEEWNRFEVRHGNEDTFREMLRIKRSVTASFSQMHFNMTTIELPSDAGTLEAGGVAAAQAAAGGGGRQGGVLYTPHSPFPTLHSPLPAPHSSLVTRSFARGRLAGFLIEVLHVRALYCRASVVRGVFETQTDDLMRRMGFDCAVSVDDLNCVPGTL